MDRNSDLFIEQEIFISASEAETGCSRLVDHPDLVRPLNINIRAGLKDGSVLRIDNVPLFLDDDSTAAGILFLTVNVKKEKHSHILLILLIVIAAAVIFGFAASRYFPSLISGVSETIDNTVQTLPETPDLNDIPIVSDILDGSESDEADQLSASEFAASVIPHYESRWYLNNLDDRLLYNFCTMYSAMYSHADSCDFEKDMTAEELGLLNHILFLECPELLLDSEWHYTYSRDLAGNVLSTTLEYSCSADEYYARRQACQDIVDNITASCEGMSEYDKELYIYKYICNNCYYSADASDCGNAYGAFVGGAAKCDGLSLAMKWACEDAGLSCLMADGYDSSDGTGHAWNIININGSYTTLNITDDVSISDEQKAFGAYSYSVFNAPKAFMHDIYDVSDIVSANFDLPDSDSYDYMYAVVNGYYITSGYPYTDTLYSRIHEILAEGGGYLRMQFESQEDYEYYRSNIEDIIAGLDASPEEASYQISCYSYDHYRFIGLLFR